MPTIHRIASQWFPKVTNESTTRENNHGYYSKPYLILLHFADILTQKHISILALIPEFIPFIHLMKAFVAYLLWQAISCRHLKCWWMQFGNYILSDV
jgi:hypothetical protein